MKKLFAIVLVASLPILAIAGGDSMKKVAKDLGRKLQKMKNPRIGLLSFPYYDGRVSSGSSILSERLMTHLADMKGVRLVERSLLKKVLEEQHLSEAGVVDAGAAQKIGRILDVDAIVTGTLNDLENGTTELNARALKVDTGEVIAASRVRVERTWSDSPRFPRDMARRAPPPHETTPEEEEEEPQENEAIMIGIPGGRGGGRGYGGSGYGR